jgi:hypothetical protein
MKKLIMGLAVAMAATLSQASYLYWQVDTTQLTSNGNGGYTFNGHAVSGFNVIATTDAAYTYGSANNHVLTTWTYGGPAQGYVSTDSNPTSVAAATSGAYAYLSSYTDSSYSYYVEIIGYDTSTSAYSGTGGIGGIGVSEATTYTAANTAGRIATTLKDIGSSPLEAWTGGAYAAPEPTSGLLLLVGGALLALRRRKA